MPHLLRESHKRQLLSNIDESNQIEEMNNRLSAEYIQKILLPYDEHTISSLIESDNNVVTEIHSFLKNKHDNLKTEINNLTTGDVLIVGDNTNPENIKSIEDYIFDN